MGPVSTAEASGIAFFDIEPKPRQMADLSKTKLYFAIGVPFENVWLEKIIAANPDLQGVHTDHGIKKRAMAAHHHDGDGDFQAAKAPCENGGQEEDHHEHNDNGLDPHIWLAPPLVKILARTISDALTRKVLFVQPQFATKSAQVVARAIGGQVVFADPLAEDWMANLHEVADKFKAALK
jgi:ABC-type Zn uptake system ZnuABC Zn-binding protein ZnuA